MNKNVQDIWIKMVVTVINHSLIHSYGNEGMNVHCVPSAILDLCNRRVGTSQISSARLHFMFL